jgi:formylglycine-generating enzyme required for sulfatase activity
MHGNLWEWCNECYAAYGGDETDPVGPAAGSGRAIRGGGWDYNARYCRSANRYGYDPGDGREIIGFRFARSAY